MKIFGKRVKLKNRRIFLSKVPGDTWVIHMKILEDFGERRIRHTKFAISDESFRALFSMYVEMYDDPVYEETNMCVTDYVKKM